MENSSKHGFRLVSGPPPCSKDLSIQAAAHCYRERQQDDYDADAARLCVPGNHPPSSLSVYGWCSEGIEEKVLSSISCQRCPSHTVYAALNLIRISHRTVRETSACANPGEKCNVHLTSESSAASIGFDDMTGAIDLNPVTTLNSPIEQNKVLNGVNQNCQND